MPACACLTGRANIRETALGIDMKSHCIVAAMVIAVSLCAPWAARAQETDIYWHHLYEKAIEEAQQTGKPLLVAFRCVP